MKPTSPVVPGMALDEIVFAKNQPQYKTLPAFRYDDGTVLTRWHMSLRERFTAFFRGDVYVWIRTFNQPLQPLKVQIYKPKGEE
jgi:hypothetical protein